jgi:hypothetical protein
MRFAAIAIALAACADSDVSRELGAECSKDRDCTDRCAVGDAWPDGMCTAGCASDADCPDGTACLAEQMGICAYTCATDAQCAFLGVDYGCHDEDRVDPMAPTRAKVCRGS